MGSAGAGYELAHLKRIVDSPLRKIENVYSYGTVRKNRKLTDGAGRTKRAEAAVWRLDSSNEARRKPFRWTRAEEHRTALVHRKSQMSPSVRNTKCASV